jgi:hypothetical protein
MIRLGALAAALLVSHLPALAQAAKPSNPSPDTLIVLDRGACEHRCAVYRIVIFADGSLIYEGRYFVRHPGLVQSSITPEALAALIDDLDSGGFFQLENNYGYGNKDHCESLEPLEPAAMLSVSTNGRAKTVLHNHGCAGAASKHLTELEDKVDRAVGAAKWIKGPEKAR